MNDNKGKITNKDSGDSLPFSIAPIDFKLSRHFDYAVSSCVGQSAPIVGYKAGSAAQLAFQLRFDKDVDKDFNSKDLDGFVKSLNKVDETKKSTPVVEFTMGQFLFKGFVSSYSFSANRFDSKGAITAAALDVTLISNGEFESGS